MKVRLNMKQIKVLEKNMTMLTRDILALGKMIERYATCRSQSLVDASENLLATREALIEKRNQVIAKHKALLFEQDDCLQDYREVLDYKKNDNLSAEDKQLLANDELREEVQGRFTHKTNYSA